MASLEVILVRLQVEKWNVMPMSSRHADGIHLGGLISVLLSGRADKEMSNLFESMIVREASRQSCDQSCVAQLVTHYKAWQH